MINEHTRAHTIAFQGDTELCVRDFREDLRDGLQVHILTTTITCLLGPCSLPNV